MKNKRLSTAIQTSFGLLLAISAGATECFAVTRNFDGGPSGLGTDFHTGINWTTDLVPTTADYGIIQDNKDNVYRSILLFSVIYICFFQTPFFSQYCLLHFRQPAGAIVQSFYAALAVGLV